MILAISVISVARFFRRDLQSVLGDKWGGRVRLIPSSVATYNGGHG
jgi:hypothetical protein